MLPMVQVVRTEGVVDTDSLLVPSSTVDLVFGICFFFCFDGGERALLELRLSALVKRINTLLSTDFWVTYPLVGVALGLINVSSVCTMIESMRNGRNMEGDYSAVISYWRCLGSGDGRGCEYKTAERTTERYGFYLFLPQKMMVFVSALFT